MDVVAIEGWVGCVRVTSRRAVGQSIVGREHPSHARAQLPRDNMRAAQSHLHVLLLTAAPPGRRYDDTPKASPRNERVQGQAISSAKDPIATCVRCDAGTSRLASKLWLVTRFWLLTDGLGRKATSLSGPPPPLSPSPPRSRSDDTVMPFIVVIGRHRLASRSCAPGDARRGRV
jgi:hypothetical protein